MLMLHGSATSNYYNKVKLALLEKGVMFTEVYAATHSTDEAILGASPLGKIPFITTENGATVGSKREIDCLTDFRKSDMSYSSWRGATITCMCSGMMT